MSGGMAEHVLLNTPPRSPYMSQSWLVIGRQLDLIRYEKVGKADL